MDKESDDADAVGRAHDLEESYSESRLELMWVDRRISVPSVCMHKCETVKVLNYHKDITLHTLVTGMVPYL